MENKTVQKELLVFVDPILDPNCAKKRLIKQTKYLNNLETIHSLFDT